VNPAGLATGLTAGNYTGTITVSAAVAANSPQTIAVYLTVKAVGTSLAPFGEFSTPADGTTGITGAIPVTGWVVDDIEVVRVDVKRDPVAGDPAGAIGPDGLVYVGDGLFVEGARPDIEIGYPGYPMNYKAGWGYMLLTNFLPAQGNGTYKLHAFAADKEGNYALLGSKTIVCDNAHATKPFGTIDTPTQGGSAAGSPVAGASTSAFVNFGWVLTPQPKTVPKDGSTITVWVDGVQVGDLSTAPNVYNQYRVDVATSFPGLNNTGGPGAGEGGPVGAFFLNTAGYANGVHTIFWIATDDAGAADGIGSRYFNILNAGAASVQNKLSHCEPLGVAIAHLSDLLSLPPSFAPLSVKRGFNLAAPAEIIAPDNYGTYHIDIKEVDLLRVSLDPEQSLDNNPPSPPFRKGGEANDNNPPSSPFSKGGEANGNNPPSPVFSKGGDASDNSPSSPPNILLSSRAPEGRMAITPAERNSPLYAGYMLVGEELRPLPIGSTLDPFIGTFSWMPGPGFVGAYDLMFVVKDATGSERAIKVKVTIRPKF